MQHPLLLSEAGGAQGLSFWSGWKTSLCFLQPRQPQNSGGEGSCLHDCWLWRCCCARRL